LRLLCRQSIQSGRRVLAEHFGQSPIHDLDLDERTDHDVGGLQIAMNDAVGVSVADSLAHGLEDRQQPAALGGGVGTLFQYDFKGAPLDEVTSLMTDTRGLGEGLA
jgi:hypothetical protein